MSWLEKVNKELDGVIRQGEGDKDVMTMSYNAVLQVVPGIYDKLFPSAVAGIMKGDITNGTKVVQDAMMEIPGGKGQTVLGIIQHHMSTLGPEKCAAAKVNGTKSLLWLNRAAMFICRLLRFLAEGKESNDAAFAAYEEILKPYHGWMTQQVVGNAVSLGPTREKVFEQLGVADATAKDQLIPFCEKMEKLTGDVKQMLIDNKAHFENTA